MPRDSIELLKDVDDAIVNEKNELRIITIKIIVFNVIMLLILAGYSIYQIGSTHWVDN